MIKSARKLFDLFWVLGGSSFSNFHIEHQPLCVKTQNDVIEYAIVMSLRLWLVNVH